MDDNKVMMVIFTAISLHGLLARKDEQQKDIARKSIEMAAEICKKIQAIDDEV